MAGHSRLHRKWSRNTPKRAIIWHGFSFEPPVLHTVKKSFHSSQPHPEFRPCPVSTSCMKTPPGCRRWPRPSTATGCPGPNGSCDEGTFDLAAPPPAGVFYNRMSASSHTRDHRYSAELTAAVLAWLTRWGRRVVNGSGALDLEISKVRQYAALERHGIATPRTVLVAGRDLSGRRAAAFRRPAGHPEAEPRRQGPRRAAFQPAATALPRSSRAMHAGAGRWAAAAAGVCPRAASGDHPRGIRRRPVPLCGRGRYQRRIRVVPRRCLRDRRRVLPGGRSAARKIHHHRGHPGHTAGAVWSVSSPDPASRSLASSSSPTPPAGRWCTT